MYWLHASSRGTSFILQQKYLDGVILQQTSGRFPFIFCAVHPPSWPRVSHQCSTPTQNSKKKLWIHCSKRACINTDANNFHNNIYACARTGGICWSHFFQHLQSWNTTPRRSLGFGARLPTENKNRKKIMKSWYDVPELVIQHHSSIFLLFPCRDMTAHPHTARITSRSHS